MSDMEQLQETLTRLEAELATVKTALNDATQNQSFEQLKEILLSDKWMSAANKNLICDPDNEADKVERGRGIIELMVETDLANKKFLDYGCGEGHCTLYAASRNPVMAVGYDVKAVGWENHKADRFTLTSDWNVVTTNAPYDVILVYDVIDHLEKQQPIEVMKQIHSVLAADGRVYLRAHPFTSRHAMHQYHDLNKAYIQLIFSPEELKILIPNAKHIEWNQARVVTPLMTYKKLFEDSGFEIINTRPVKDVVESFFKSPAISKRIIKTVGLKDFPEFQMGMQFIDTTLRKTQ